MSDWPTSTLGEATSIVSGIGFPKSYQGRDHGDVPFLKVRDVSATVLSKQTKVTLAQHYVSEDECRELRGKPLLVGSVIFAKIGEGLKLNRRAVLAMPALVDNNVMGVKAGPLLCDSYLYHYLCTIDLGELSQATTVPSVRKSDVAQIAIPLPPLPEQQRIVARIEELFTRLDGGLANLQHAKAQIQRYRQAVLRDAFTGDPGALSWHTVGDLGAVTGGLTKSSKRNSLAVRVPYLRVANVYANRLELDSITEIGVKSGEMGRVALEKGDLLVVEGNGSVSQIGRVAVWNGSIAVCAHQNHIIKVRFPKPKLGEYVMWWLLSPDGRKAIESVASSTSGLHTLNLSKIKALPVPMLPDAQRQGVVSEIERHFSIADAADAALAQAESRANALRQSILKEAFAGRLL